MKILAIADVETEVLSRYYKENGYDLVDVIVSCGDLSQDYLTTVQNNIGKPLIYIRGNHDLNVPKISNAMCIDCKIVTVNGIRLCGFSSIDRFGRILTDAQMWWRIRWLKRKIKKAGGVDILVTHHPMWGVDGDDSFHKGYRALKRFVEEFEPRYMLYGHVHLSYQSGLKRAIDYGNTKLVNAYEKTVIEIYPKEN